MDQSCKINENPIMKNSLKRMANRSILFGASTFLVLLLITEMFLFVFPTMGSYKKEFDHESKYVADLIGMPYIEDIIKRTKDIYYSTPEEIRHDQFDDEYRDLLIPLVDDDFRAARNYLFKCRENADLVDMFICFYDKDTERIVFVVDGNLADNAFLPGQWISEENAAIDDLKTINHTISSLWFMPFDYGYGWGFTATDYLDLLDENGEVIGYLATDVSLNDFVSHLGWLLAINIPVLAVIFLIFSYLASGYLNKKVIGPINMLASAAKEYGGIDISALSYGDKVFSRLRIDTGDEIEQLWETMVDMEKDISSAMKRIIEATAKEKRIEAELDFAKNIQASALPTSFPAFPDRDEFDIYANMTPAREVGGDFYDFFLIDKDHLGIVIADVSGKGIPAALFMMNCKTLIKITAIHGGSPSEIISFVNQKLCEDNVQEMFVTIWLGILNISSGEVVACNAGHEYPFVTDNEGSFTLLKDPHDLVCGIMDDVTYEDYSFSIPKGGKLFVYTDGVAEAQDKEEEMFGLTRIENSLNSGREGAPVEIVEHVKKDLSDFVDGAEQFDDITMVTLWYK